MGGTSGKRIEVAGGRHDHPGIRWAGWLGRVSICAYLIGCEPTPMLHSKAASDTRTYPRISIGGFEVQAPPDHVVVAKPVVDVEPEFEIVRVQCFGYCPCARCCGRMTGITSTQSNAWVPGIAADPTWLPPGTVVHVPGYGKATVDDTGGKMKRRYWTGVPRLDARFSYHWEARNWGVQYLDVKVYRRK